MLTLLLLPVIHTSDDMISLPVSNAAQAIAVVHAYGVDNLDHASLVRKRSGVLEGSPYEELMDLNSFKDLI